MKYLFFWISLIAILASWELLIIFPSYIPYLLALSLVSSLACTAVLLPVSNQWKYNLFDRILFLAFTSGVFWWMLWVDFGIAKYVIPTLLWAPFAYLLNEFYNQQKTIDQFSEKLRLALFLGSTFFWSIISFGSGIILGLPSAVSMAVFIFVFLIISWAISVNITRIYHDRIKIFLLLNLLSCEAFAVLIWLPFAEITLGSIISIFIFAVFDMLKYYVDESIINYRIIFRKILIYSFFIAIILLSTPWLK